MFKKTIVCLAPLFFLVNINADDLAKDHETLQQKDFKSTFTYYSKVCGALGVMYERELGLKQDYKKH